MNRGGIRFGLAGFLTLTCLAWAVVASAQSNLLWTDSAGSNTITAVDKTTGTVLKTFNPAKGNGRGVVTVGNVVYYTVANSGNIFALDATTGADIGPGGVAFNIPGATGLSTIAFDGTNFWVGDYSGTNQAYYVSPTGTLIKTIHLANCTSFCDGLEFFNGKLISNRGDSISAIYDVYDTNGVLLQAAFINHPTTSGRGIAFDGTNFFVADATIIYVFDGTTGAFVRQFTPGGSNNFEDLSLDYTIVIVPTMPEWLFAGLALMLMAGAVLALRRRARRLA